MASDHEKTMAKLSLFPITAGESVLVMAECSLMVDKHVIQMTRQKEKVGKDIIEKQGIHGCKQWLEKAQDK